MVSSMETMVATTVMMKKDRITNPRRARNRVVLARPVQLALTANLRTASSSD